VTNSNMKVLVENSYHDLKEETFWCENKEYEIDGWCDTWKDLAPAGNFYFPMGIICLACIIAWGLVNVIQI
jgi:hypothetical protein